MQLLLAIMIGFFYAAGIYMMLRRSLVKLLIGLILLGNGANMLIFCWDESRGVRHRLLTKGRMC